MAPTPYWLVLRMRRSCPKNTTGMLRIFVVRSQESNYLSNWRNIHWEHLVDWIRYIRWHGGIPAGKYQQSENGSPMAPTPYWLVLRMRRSCFVDKFHVQKMLRECLGYSLLGVRKAIIFLIGGIYIGNT
eukprot:sb/3475269/